MPFSFQRSYLFAGLPVRWLSSADLEASGRGLFAVSFPKDRDLGIKGWIRGPKPTSKAAEKKPPQISLDKHRIAVLPFANISPDPNDEYFADGLTEELISKLSLVSGLEVIARTSVMSYKKKEKKVSEIGRELGAGTLVEGSVRKAGNKIRVSVQLVSANTEGHLWSSVYDKDFDDIFAIQSDIASNVAESIPVSITRTRTSFPEGKDTKNTRSYSHFLKARQLLHEGTEGLLRKALMLFEKSIELDPLFARAYVGLADCYLRLGNNGYDPMMESIENARSL